MVYDLAPVPNSLLDGITFTDPSITGRLRFAASLSFIVLPASEDRIQLAGFHADEAVRDTIVPAIKLGQRPEGSRGLGKNAKGAGVMLGDSGEAVDNIYEELSRPARSGAIWLTPALSSDDIIDLHHPNPQRLDIIARGIARHAGYIARSILTSAESTVTHIEGRYDDKNVAIIDPAPTWLLSQRRRHIKQPIPPVWALYRDRQRRPLVKIGTYDMSRR